MITGAKLIFNRLVKNNVTSAFIYSGGSIMPVIDQFYKNDKIKYYINTHEQSTGHSATGYAKASGKTGVCIVTSGPGITNMITPMLDATNDSTPLVVLSGQVSKSALGTNAFQEAPAVDISKNVTKWSYQLQNISDINSVIDKAFEIANHGKKGAVHIDIPKDISSGEYDSNELSKLRLPELKSLPTFNKKITDKIIHKINNSEKPLIYLGQGCINDWKLLRNFAQLGNIPVTSTIHGKGIFDDHHPLSLEWCGMHGHAAANFALQEADCIIALGSRFDDRTTGLISEYAPIARKNNGIIHINIEESEINKVIKSDYHMNTSCYEFLEYAIPKIQYNSNTSWINQIQNDKYKFSFVNKLSTDSYLTMEDVLDRVYRKTLDENVIFTTGVGNHQMQAYQFIKSQYPNKIISSGSLGVMGAGLPYSIGAQLSCPEKMVINIDGDSSFNMTMNELKTIKEYNLPIKIMIMNNDAQMMVNIWEKLFFGERYTATINNKNPSYTKLANSFDIMSLYCNSVKELDKTIDDFINYPESILCEFKIKKDVCLPLVGPGKALHEMILPGELLNKYTYKAVNAPS